MLLDVHFHILSNSSFLFYQVHHHLDVKGHAFEGIKIDGTFIMNKVTMQKVDSLAFNFDYVHDFTIIASRFDRIAMWGFKLGKCDEFNVIGGSRFYSLTTNSFQMQCNKFWLLNNTFDR